jgi:hypothetical protein
MKPQHIALLLVAGAGGGALVMMVAQYQRPAAPVPAAVVAQAPAPVATPPAQALPPEPAAPQALPPVEEQQPPVQHKTARPSPFEAPRPGRTHVAPGPKPEPEPQPQPAQIHPTPAPVIAAPPVSAPAAADHPAPPDPPARAEAENVTPPRPPTPPEPARVTLNAGTLISVRLVDGLNAERNVAGDPFTATLDKELVVDGFVIAERGARVEGRVTAVDPGGRVRGVSTLGVELTRLHTSDGQYVPIRTDPFERRAQATHGEDAAKVGAGAALGAMIGAIAGGGKGAAIGAGAGGAAGAGAVMATRGKPAALPSETHVNFRLAAAVNLVERR